MSVLSLHCGAGFFLVAASGGYSLVAGSRLLSLKSTGSRAFEHMCSHGSRAREHRMKSCGAWVSWLHGMWDLPESGIKPVSPGGFFTTEPPEKHPSIIFKLRKIVLNRKYFFESHNFIMFMKIFRARVMRIPRSSCLNT